MGKTILKVDNLKTKYITRYNEDGTFRGGLDLSFGFAPEVALRFYF